MRSKCSQHGMTESNSWKFIGDKAYCEKCYLPTAFRAGILTSNSSRIYRDRLENQRELIQPYEGSKPNPEFLKNYPSHSPDYYSDKELKDMGAGKLKSRKGKPFKNVE